MRRSLLSLLPMLLALGPASDAAPRPVVAVSVAPLGEIVSRLAGDAVEVVTLVPPGVDVESFAPTVQQAAALDRARLVVAVGDPAFALETRLLGPWQARHRGEEIVTLADHVRGLPGSDPGAAPQGDPHLWVSPRIVRGAAGELAAKLERLLPGQAESIRSRAVALDSDIMALDERLRRRFGGRGGRFLIDHPSLGHLARDYGLEQIAIERDGKEPTPGQLARLVERARRDGFRHVLTQPGPSRRAARVLAGEIGATLVEVDPLAPDWLASLDRIGDSVARALVRD